MELRDYKEYTRFLSIFSMSDGTCVYRGPKFLKRYFILNDELIPGASPVLPYKPFLEPLVRMCTVDREDNFLGALLKTYGHAWESYGTNEITYSCARHMYDNLVASGHVKTPREMIHAIVNSKGGERKLNDLSRRIGLTAEEIFNKFPLLYELKKRHIYSPDKCDYRKHRDYIHLSNQLKVKKIVRN